MALPVVAVDHMEIVRLRAFWLDAASIARSAVEDALMDQNLGVGGQSSAGDVVVGRSLVD